MNLYYLPSKIIKVRHPDLFTDSRDYDIFLANPEIAGYSIDFNYLL